MVGSNVWNSWERPVKPSAVDWIPKNVWLPPGGEKDGLFNFDDAPHTKGVIEAWDDDSVREITLCWATRNAKTTTMISLMCLVGANYPSPMGYGSCDEMSVDRSIDEQLYPMLERCEGTRRKLPPPSRRARNCIWLQNCRIRKAFGGSAPSVAGWPAKYIFINEADKWPRRQSSEADSLRGFSQRVKGFPFDSKILKESTPGELETSRIWADLTAETTDQRRYWVPCPHCGEFQLLDFGDRDSHWGIKWDKPKSGRTELIRAQETAYYLCIHNGCKIGNEDRAIMMRQGAWLSMEQSITRDGRIIGEHKPSWHIGFGPLGSEYSLLISGWGQLVKDFLSCGNDPEKLRDFTNSSRALPWDPKPVTAKPSDLAERLASNVSLGVCPEWAVFLTRGVDVQDEARTFVSDVVAWGPRGRSQVIDRREFYSQADYAAHHKSALYRHADGGPPLEVIATLMDSGDGDVSDEIYRFCRTLPRCLPCKGASAKMERAVKPSPLHDSEGVPVQLMMINTHRSQNWLEGHLKGTTQGEPFTIALELRWDMAYLEQLLAEVKVCGKWEKTGTNDHRDAVRYAWAGAMYCTDEGAAFDHMQPRMVAKIPVAQYDDDDSGPVDTFATRGGGRTWN